MIRDGSRTQGSVRALKQEETVGIQSEMSRDWPRARPYGTQSKKFFLTASSIFC